MKNSLLKRYLIIQIIVGFILLLAIFVTQDMKSILYTEPKQEPIVQEVITKEIITNNNEDLEKLEKELLQSLDNINNRIDILEMEQQQLRDDLEQYRIKFTLEELEHLLSLVQHEAGAESYECQLMIASVIVNRVDDERYPNNLWDVIYQTEPTVQFSPVIDGLYKEPSESVRKAVREALKNDYSQGAWIFNNRTYTADSLQQWFDKFEIVASIDGVDFRK